MNKLLMENEPKFNLKTVQDEFYNLKEDDIRDDNEIEAIVNIYSKTKDLSVRNTCLMLLYNKNNNILKIFFETAYKKERYLDMKIRALRGLMHFIPENDVKKLLAKFNEVLKKRKKTTPYNYQEYELLLGKNSLPYLYKKYQYECIKETLDIVQNQYDEMPEAFKGNITYDENGKTVYLRKLGEIKKRMTDFLEQEREKYK